MSLKVIWSESWLGRLAGGFSRAIDHSTVLNWYLGGDRYHDLVIFRSSVMSRILAFKGRCLSFLIRGTGRFLHALLEPTASYQMLTHLYGTFSQQPVRLLSLLGLSSLLTNSAVLLVQNPHWPLRSIVLRGGLAVLLALGLTVRVSWQQLGNSSIVVRLARDFVLGD